MNIQLLYFEGCPNFKPALFLLREVLREEGVQDRISLINVKSEEEAVELGFPGSPSIRVNGMDVEESARKRTEAGIKCRVYVTDKGFRGYPDKEMLRKAIRDAILSPAPEPGHR